jgi:hypothetical protein
VEVWIAEKEDDAREMATFNALFFAAFRLTYLAAI